MQAAGLSQCMGGLRRGVEHFPADCSKPAVSRWIQTDRDEVQGSIWRRRAPRCLGFPQFFIGSGNLKQSRRLMAAVLAVVAMISLENHESYAQMMTQDKPPIAYFLDRVPEKLDVSTLPKAAREVVVARVRVEGRLAYLVGRDQSGRPPQLPPYLFYARLKILDVRSGNATVGATVDVTFGVPNASERIHYPHTPTQLDRDYHVVMYSGDDDGRHLAGFPTSETQYREWDTEVRTYNRSRSAPPK